MEIKILGAHLIETADVKLTSILVDGVLALDAGGLLSGLTSNELQKLKAILITHHHYDHVRDIPIIGIIFTIWGTIEIYSTTQVLDILSSYLLDGKLYPNFLEFPEERPSIKLKSIEPQQPFRIGDYKIVAIPVNHTVSTVGYEITSPDGKKLFYTGDTGPGLSECWKKVQPNLLITEVSVPQMFEKKAIEVGHLTPQLLKTELQEFRSIHEYIPDTIIIHMNPFLEKEIETELAEVARALGAKISLGREGMIVNI